jgi:hypothetical protein
MNFCQQHDALRDDIKIGFKKGLPMSSHGMLLNNTGGNQKTASRNCLALFLRTS